LLQKGKKSAHEKYHNAKGLFSVGFYPACSVIIIIGDGKVNKAFWSGISHLMKETAIVSETLVRFNHLALPIVPNDVID
jgi:hypothetical protein